MARSHAYAGKCWYCPDWRKARKNAQRHIEGGAVTLGPSREKVSDRTFILQVADGVVLRVEVGERGEAAGGIDHR